MICPPSIPSFGHTHTLCSSDLVALQGEEDDHLKALALAEGHLIDVVLSSPPATFEDVAHHHLHGCEPRVKVKGLVTPFHLPAAKVDGEPVGGERAQITKKVYYYDVEPLWSQDCAPQHPSINFLKIHLNLQHH